MDKARWLTVMTIAWALLCPFVPNIASQSVTQGTLTLDRGLTYEMSYDDGHWATRVYVTPAAPNAGDISLSLRGVAMGTRTDPSLARFFLPPQRFPKDGKISGFDIQTVDNPTMPRGTYDLMLVATDSVGTQHAMNIQVMLPRAIIKQPARLLISRTIPLWGKEDSNTTPLLLSETGMKSPARLSIVQSDFFADEKDEYDASCSSNPYYSNPANRFKFPTTSRGRFPLGRRELIYR
jgi:hypothetical protein